MSQPANPNRPALSRVTMFLACTLSSALPGIAACAAAAAPSADTWNCSASGQGWLCQNPSPGIRSGKANKNSAYLGAYPDAYRLDGATRSSILNPAQAPWAYMDWYPNKQGVDPISHCDGRYEEPLFEPANDDPDDRTLYLQADRSRTQVGKESELVGDILLQQGSSRLRAQRAEMDHQNSQGELSGLIQMRDPGMLLLGQRAAMDGISGETTLEDAQFVIHASHLRGEADSITRYGDGTVRIRDGVYTRCEPGNDSWTINGSEILLRPETGLGSARNSTLRIAGVPVLYVPYIYFPINNERHSGFLAPSLGQTTTSGIELSVPYYFNLAPQYDDTLTPRFLSKRGVMLENEFRYLHESGSYQLSSAFLPNDDKALDDRWLLGLKHQGSPAPQWDSGIDFTSVSDNDYFSDLNNELGISEQTHLNQQARLRYRGDDWLVQAKLQSYQTIDTASTTPYRKLPELTLRGNQRLVDSGRARLRYSGELTSFVRDTDGFIDDDRTNGSRAHLQAAASIRAENSWGYFEPSLGLSHTQYWLKYQPDSDPNTPSRTLPQISMDSGITLERPLQDGAVQTLEPRLFYLYVPYEDQDQLPNFDSSEQTFSYYQLFNTNRFSGIDRIGDSRQITLGLTSRLLDPSGDERIRGSLGQIFYLDQRQVRLDDGATALDDSRSSIAAEAFWRVTPTLRLSADAEWAHASQDNIQRNIKLNYRRDLDHQINLNYRFTRDSVEQSDISWIWPLNPRWSILGRWLNDIRNGESLDQVAGLEYENCCWRVRTLWREWIDDDTDNRENNGIFLQFILKGLGSVGAGAGGDAGPKARVFLQDISGFRERENND